MTDDEKLEAACDWSDYRSEYGVSEANLVGRAPGVSRGMEGWTPRRAVQRPSVTGTPSPACPCCGEPADTVAWHQEWTDRQPDDYIDASIEYAARPEKVGPPTCTVAPCGCSWRGTYELTDITDGVGHVITRTLTAVPAEPDRE